jgi:hypothetical protein
MYRRRGSNRNNAPTRLHSRTIASTAAILVMAFGIVIFISYLVSNQRAFPTASSSNAAFETADYRGRVKVFSAYMDHSIARKQRQDLSASPLVEHIVLNTKEQAEFLRANSCAEGALERFQKLVDSSREHLALELFKFCALKQYGGMYVDAESPLVDTLDHLLAKEGNVAVLNDPSFPRSIHGSLLILRQVSTKRWEKIVLIEVRLSHPVVCPAFSPFLR